MTIQTKQSHNSSKQQQEQTWPYTKATDYMVYRHYLDRNHLQLETGWMT